VQLRETRRLLPAALRKLPYVLPLTALIILEQIIWNWRL